MSQLFACTEHAVRSHLMAVLCRHPGPVSDFIVNASGLSVGILTAKVTAQVQTVIAGASGTFLAPIPSDYLSTPHTLPQVTA